MKDTDAQNSSRVSQVRRPARFNVRSADTCSRQRLPQRQFAGRSGSPVASPSRFFPGNAEQDRPELNEQRERRVNLERKVKAGVKQTAGQRQPDHGNKKPVRRDATVANRTQ